MTISLSLSLSLRLETYDEILNFEIFANFMIFFLILKPYFKFLVDLTAYIINSKLIIIDWFIYFIAINFSQVQMYDVK